MATKRDLNKYIKIAKSNYSIFEIPFDRLIVDECLEIVRVNGLCLRYVPLHKRTKKVCVVALENNDLALEYVPDKYKTIEMCDDLYKKNVFMFPFLLKSMYTLEICIDCYTRLLNYDGDYVVSLSKIANAVPYYLHDNYEIFNLERKLGIRQIINKEYNNGMFYVTERVSYDTNEIINEFDIFEEFYAFIDFDLTEANLLEYDFKSVSINELGITESNLNKAYIKSEVLIENNMYSNKSYNNYVQELKDTTELIEKEELDLCTYYVHENSDGLSDDVRKIYYISDLHLNHKIKQAFPVHATENEIRLYMRNLVNGLKIKSYDKLEDCFLMIAGDVSYNYKLAELFYSELIKVWDASRIIVVLGNHDIWNYDMKSKNNSIKDIIKKYRDLFERLHINFLHNEILLAERIFVSGVIIKKISQDEILTNGIEWLKEKCKHSCLTVIGGIGFSGFNNEFNAEHGIYRNTIMSLNEDLKYTNEFKELYIKTYEALRHKKVIVLTHMPSKDWGIEELNSKWIYVNGHTHRNYFQQDENGIVYADNQVGYYTQSMSLKMFYVSRHYDIFCDYEDGIYNIDKDDYIDFNRGKNISITFTRTTGQIIMLKRWGLYSFFYKDKDKLYFLKGGAIRKLKEQNIQYYYDNMILYRDALKDVMKSYYDVLKRISDIVKSIGGIGTIHGNIVDIDWFNHIYVNPINGNITPYYAVSIYERYNFHSVENLLKNNREDLYLTYKAKYIDQKDENNVLNKNSLILSNNEIVEFVSDTGMYGPSNMFRSLQYMFDVDVIREWNEEVVEKLLSKYNANNILEDKK